MCFVQRRIELRPPFGRLQRHRSGGQRQLAVAQVVGGSRIESAVGGVEAGAMQILHRTGVDAARGRFDAAAADYLSYRKLALAAAPVALQAAERWSQFNPALHETHQAALQPTAAGKAVSR